MSSLSQLVGAACTTASGLPGALAVTVGSNGVVTLLCSATSGGPSDPGPAYTASFTPSSAVRSVINASGALFSGTATLSISAAQPGPVAVSFSSPGALTVTNGPIVIPAGETSVEVSIGGFGDVGTVDSVTAALPNGTTATFTVAWRCSSSSLSCAL